MKKTTFSPPFTFNVSLHCFPSFFSHPFCLRFSPFLHSISSPISHTSLLSFLHFFLTPFPLSFPTSHTHTHAHTIPLSFCVSPLPLLLFLSLSLPVFPLLKPERDSLTRLGTCGESSQ